MDKLNVFVLHTFRKKLAKLYSKDNWVLAINHHRISRDGSTKILAHYALVTKMSKDILVITMNH